MCARTMCDEVSEGRGREVAMKVAPAPVARGMMQAAPHKARRHHAAAASTLPMDNIAILTAYTKKASDFAYQAAAAVSKSHYYVVLTRTTQPAHAMLFAGVLVVASSLSPNHAGSSKSTASALLYLACFAAHFGAQLWMTFVSGLSLYFSLPRHNFGAVQRVLFPRYFALNAILSMGTLLGFARQHPTNAWDGGCALQGLVLSACFLSELAVRLYLTGPLVSLISAKEEIESRVGLGQEIGRQEMGELVACPHYRKLHQRFRKVHATIAVANMACLASSAFHLHYMAQQLAASVS